jgi:hypothetical protein
MPLSFTVTLYGANAHAERNVAQKLWGALEKAHETSPVDCAMLIGEAKTEPPCDDSEPINLRTAAEIEGERLARKRKAQ